MNPSMSDQPISYDDKNVRLIPEIGAAFKQILAEASEFRGAIMCIQDTIVIVPGHLESHALDSKFVEASDLLDPEDNPFDPEELEHLKTELATYDPASQYILIHIARRQVVGDKQEELTITITTCTNAFERVEHPAANAHNN